METGSEKKGVWGVRGCVGEGLVVAIETVYHNHWKPCSLTLVDLSICGLCREKWDRAATFHIQGHLVCDQCTGSVCLFVSLAIIFTATVSYLISRALATFPFLYAFFIKTLKLKVSVAEALYRMLNVQYISVSWQPSLELLTASSWCSLTANCLSYSFYFTAQAAIYLFIYWMDFIVLGYLEWS